jgi:stage V sporulation protein G
MRITDVRIRKVNDEGKMKAVVSVTFDDEFVVHDIKIIEGQNGLFIAMPSRKMGEGDFRDIAHPLTSETRNRIKTAIFDEYQKVLEEKKDDDTSAVKAYAEANVEEEAIATE